MLGPFLERITSSQFHLGWLARKADSIETKQATKTRIEIPILKPIFVRREFLFYFKLNLTRFIFIFRSHRKTNFQDFFVPTIHGCSARAKRATAHRNFSRSRHFGEPTAHVGMSTTTTTATTACNCTDLVFEE